MPFSESLNATIAFMLQELPNLGPLRQFVKTIFSTILLFKCANTKHFLEWQIALEKDYISPL